jgi:hypothetical protein
MYENAKAQTGCIATCAPVAPEAITSKANDLVHAAQRIKGIADSIDAKLYGAKPCKEETATDPYCIEGYLADAYKILESAYSTLSGVMDRL